MSSFIYLCGIKASDPVKPVNCKVLKGYQGIKSNKDNQYNTFTLVMSDPKNRIFSLEVTPVIYYKGLINKKISLMLCQREIDPTINEIKNVHIGAWLLDIVILIIWFFISIDL